MGKDEIGSRAVYRVIRRWLQFLFLLRCTVMSEVIDAHHHLHFIIAVDSYNGSERQWDTTDDWIRVNVCEPHTLLLPKKFVIIT